MDECPFPAKRSNLKPSPAEPYFASLRVEFAEQTSRGTTIVVDEESPVFAFFPRDSGLLYLFFLSLLSLTRSLLR